MWCSITKSSSLLSINAVYIYDNRIFIPKQLWTSGTCYWLKFNLWCGMSSLDSKDLCHTLIRILWVPLFNTNLAIGSEVYLFPLTEFPGKPISKSYIGRSIRYFEDNLLSCDSFCELRVSNSSLSLLCAATFHKFYHYVASHFSKNYLGFHLSLPF